MSEQNSSCQWGAASVWLSYPYRRKEERERKWLCLCRGKDEREGKERLVREEDAGETPGKDGWGRDTPERRRGAETGDTLLHEAQQKRQRKGERETQKDPKEQAPKLPIATNEGSKIPHIPPTTNTRY